jgi:hypothetical protein
MVRYRKLSKIGSGGQGEVYRAVREDGQLVAVKYLKAGADEDQRKRFKREVRLQSLLSHPNILPLLGYRLDDENPCFAMPLAKSNLRDCLPDLRANTALAFSYYEQILAALEHAHANNVLHRDLKPENILILEDPEGDYPAMSDFGAGKELDRPTTPLTASTATMGTAGYAAPEEYGGARDVDERCDVYALGVILYEILMGQLPSTTSDLSALPNGLGHVVEKCLQQNPDDRYASVAQLRGDFTMFTTQTELLEQPVQAAKGLIERLAVKAAIGRDDVFRLNTIFQHNLDDELLLRGTFARLPDNVLDAYVNYLRTPFRRVLGAYDEAVSGALAFEYCDVVAGFYRKLYGLFTDAPTRKLLLGRLLEIGVSHNRFFVMDVVMDILGGMSSPSEAAMARDVLAEHEYECGVLKERLLAELRLPLLRETVEQVTSGHDDGGG